MKKQLFTNRAFLPLVALLIGIIAIFIYYGVDKVESGAMRMMLAMGALATCGLVIASYIGIFLKKVPIENVFVIAAVFIGGMFSIVFTPYSAPDENRHIETAYYYSNLVLLQKGEQARQGDFQDPVLTKLPSEEIYKDLITNTDVFYNDAQTTLVYKDLDRVSAPPYLYLPGTLGIAVGRIFHLGFRPILYLGTWMNLALYIVSLWYSIKKTPVGKAAFFTVALLPMSLHLAASMSYDSAVISLSAIFLSTVFHVIYSEERISRRDMLIAVISIILLAPCKYMYAFLVGLLWLIPKEKLSGKKRTIVQMVAVGGVLLSIVLFSGAIYDALFSGTQEITSENRETFYSIGWIFKNIGETILIFIRTLFEKLDFYWKSMLGSSLSWFSVSISDYLLLPLTIALFLSGMRNEEDRIMIQPRQKVNMGIILLLGAAAACISMFLAWTSYAPKVVIEGVQGRYFLPYLPLFILLFRGKGIIIRQSAYQKIQMVVTTVSALTATNAFVRIITL